MSTPSAMSEVDSDCDDTNIGWWAPNSRTPRSTVVLLQCLLNTSGNDWDGRCLLWELVKQWRKWKERYAIRLWLRESS